MTQESFENRTMKILIILPRAQAHKLEFGPINMSFREAPLTATTLAALVPRDLKADVKIVDESVSTVPFDKHFDLVGISVMTGTAPRAYELARIFKAKGSTIVLGGVHVKLLPDEAAQHADAIVVGFAEKTWPQLLHDFARGEMKSRYEDRQPSVAGMPIPRRELQKRFGYTMPNTVFATRGCRARCEFCSVVAADFGWHTRPVGEVIDEIRQIKSTHIAFNDVNLTDDPYYARELLKAMIPLKKKWGGLAQTRIVYDDELLDLLAESGCGYLLIGFESFNSFSLSGINKRFNKFEEYKLLMDKLHARQIMVQGCFIFGIDGEDTTVFKNTVDYIQDLKIDIPRYAVFTPYPGTESYAKLKAENRLLHERWNYYDTQHVVFQPTGMSPRELDEGFKWAYRETFTLKNIKHRTLGGKYWYVGYVGNLAYKMYIKKLYNEKHRFPADLDPALINSRGTIIPASPKETARLAG